MGAVPGQTPPPGQTLAPGVAIGAPTAKKKKKISNGAMVAIAAVLGLIVVALGAVLIYRVSKNKKAKIYNALVIQAKDPDVKKISVKKEQIEILLDAATFIGKASERETIYQCLLLAESVDGTDVDKTIAERAVAPVLAPDIRIKLFKVLERRGNSEVLPTLLGFAENPGKMTPSKMNEIAAALEACRKMGGDENFGQFLDVLENTDNVQVQKAAETTVGQIIDRSKNSGKLASLLAAAYDKQVDEDRRLAIIRLLGHAGGDQARDIVEKALGSDDPKDQIAAIFAVGAWPDDSMFETLMDYLADCEDLSLRRRAFDAGRRFLNNPRRKRSPEDSEDYWKMLAGNAKTNGEMIAIIDDVARQKGDWVISVIEYFADTAENDKVIDRAEKALDFVRERERVEKKDDGGE
jgi:HEAT repeat protein